MKRQRRSQAARRPAAVLLGIFAALTGACSTLPAGHDPVLAERLDAILLRLADSGATVAARVVELPGRRELYARNIDEPRLPASNMKILISSAGLDMFGPEHLFNTYLAYDGESLWLLGTGDPAIGDAPIARTHDRTTTSVLEEWAQTLLDKGITHIPGKLYYYEGAFDAWQLHPTWDHDDLVHWYAAPVSGLNFNGNCVDITVYPTNDGEPAGYEVVPPVRDVVVLNECVSGRDAPPTISKMAYANVYVLGGGCTERKTLKSKPIGEPGAFFADALRLHLAKWGITIEGETASSATPLDGLMPPQPERIIATHESRMTDVLWRINKSSQNLFAEALCKMTGRAFEARRGRDVPGSWPLGERAAREFLRRNGIDDSRFVLADGSGLSSDNCVTPRLISDILAVMFEHPHAEAFRASLAEPGESGTIGKRMEDLAGHVFAKTGYIRGVRALSGYIHTRTDRWLCFSIIYNNIPASVRPFNDLQDEACHLLVDWPELPEASVAEEPESAAGVAHSWPRATPFVRDSVS